MEHFHLCSLFSGHLRVPLGAEQTFFACSELAPSLCRFKPGLFCHCLTGRDGRRHRPQPGFPTGCSSMGCGWVVMRVETVMCEDGRRPLGCLDLGTGRLWTLRTGERRGCHNHFQTLEHLSRAKGLGWVCLMEGRPRGESLRVADITPPSRTNTTSSEN